MSEVTGKLKEISERLLQDMPLFIKSGYESFVSLFLFTLLLFFMFMLLQTTKNLLINRGSKILPYGICLIALVFVFYSAFSPKAFFGADTPSITRVELKGLSNGKAQGERFLFISEREKLAALLRECMVTRSLMPAKSAEKAEKSFIVTIIFDDGSESEILISDNTVIYQPLPKTGRIMRCVSNNCEIYDYVSNLRI